MRSYTSDGKRSEVGSEETLINIKHKTWRKAPKIFFKEQFIHKILKKKKKPFKKVYSHAFCKFNPQQNNNPGFLLSSIRQFLSPGPQKPLNIYERRARVQENSINVYKQPRSGWEYLEKQRENKNSLENQKRDLMPSGANNLISPEFEDSLLGVRNFGRGT